MGEKEKIKHRNQKGIAYKCNKCSYIVYINENDLPPAFCPNCAINEPKGDMICIEPFYSEAEEKNNK